MKTIKATKFLAILSIIGILFIACDFFQPSITISGIPKVGETITAEAGSGFWLSDFQWEFSASDNPFVWRQYPSDGAFGPNWQNITLQANRLGMWIRAYRTVDGGERMYSNILGPIEAAN